MPNEPRYATPGDVERLARQWSEEQLSCRLYGHVWRPLRATFHSLYRYFYTVQLCPRCEAERHTELNEHGHIVASWIKYANGYLAEKIGRIVGDGRDTLRLAALSRVYVLEAIDDPEEHARSRAARGLVA